MMTMANLRAAARGISASKGRKETLLLLPVKMYPEQRRRFKVACAEMGMTYAQLIDHLLNEREKTLDRKRRAQASPLHQPRSGVSAYPGGRPNG